MSSTLTIEELVLPASADGPDAADFLEAAELTNEVARRDAGTDDLSETPTELLSRMRTDADTVTRTFLVREQHRITGIAMFSYPPAEPTSAWLDLLVLPEDRGHGVEEALLARVEEESRSLGRNVVQAWTLHSAGSAEHPLRPATGWGSVSRTAAADFLERSGYVLEQVERNSAFDLRAPIEGVKHALDAALAAAGEDYRLVEWTIPTPPEHLAGYAWALSRMSTDVPSGALEIDEEKWDGARVRRREARVLDAGQTMSVTAALHVPTGRLAAFNELVVGAEPDDVTHQYSTLVLKEHRGHRLGMLVKCANIVRWRDIAPQSPKISTFNAEENRPMLDINEAIGFVPVSYAAAWQKKLA